MRLVFITMEFSAGTFSGNGVYARAQVRGLTRLGHEVFVIMGTPAQHCDEPVLEGACKVFEVRLSSWGTLDCTSAWEEFASGAASSALARAVSQYKPSAVLGVDWSSLPAYKILAAGLEQLEAHTPPYIYMNYRVFHRSVPVQDKDFMYSAETSAIQAAALITVLSRSDEEYLSSSLGASKLSRPLKVLLPPLRADLEAAPLLALAPQCHKSCQIQARHRNGPALYRRFLSCCVRLSEEKNPELFVSTVECLADAGHLQRLQIVPFFSASAATPYAQALKKRLRAAVPCAVIEEKFLGPLELAAVYAQTVLNLHPCLYDAYGMTVVEAASQGAPSLVNQGGTVGATDLLRSACGEVLMTDLSAGPTALAGHIAGLLANQDDLRRVGLAAAQRARSWTEAANAQSLVNFVAQVVV